MNHTDQPSGEQLENHSSNTETLLSVSADWESIWTQMYIEGTNISEVPNCIVKTSGEMISITIDGGKAIMAFQCPLSSKGYPYFYCTYSYNIETNLWSTDLESTSENDTGVLKHWEEHLGSSIFAHWLDLSNPNLRVSDGKRSCYYSFPNPITQDSILERMKNRDITFMDLNRFEQYESKISTQNQIEEYYPHIFNSWILLEKKFQPYDREKLTLSKYSKDSYSEELRLKYLEGIPEIWISKRINTPQKGHGFKSVVIYEWNENKLEWLLKDYKPKKEEPYNYEESSGLVIVDSSMKGKYLHPQTISNDNMFNELSSDKKSFYKEPSRFN